MAETIGFIGLGKMGEPIAANLLKASYRLKIFNRTASKAAPLAAQGATIASSPRDVAEPAGIVVTMLADDRAVEEVSLGRDSFVERLGKGGVHVSLSTISPDASRRLAEHHAKFGVAYVAAPVFGRPPAAAAKLLWICTSGNAEARQRVHPLLAAIGQGQFDFGDDPGAASIVKLCGNFLIASAIESMSEALILAQKNGIDPSKVADMLGKTIFACPLYQNYGKSIAKLDVETSGFDLVLGLKDVNLVLQTGETSATPMPVASLMRDRLITSVARGRSRMDWTAVVLNVAEEAGLK